MGVPVATVFSPFARWARAAVAPVAFPLVALAVGVVSGLEPTLGIAAACAIVLTMIVVWDLALGVACFLVTYVDALSDKPDLSLTKRAPRVARIPGHEPIVGGLHADLRRMIAFQCVLLAPAVVWADPITELLLGPGHVGASVLAALAPYIFFSGVAPILGISLNSVGEARRRVPILLATVILILGGSALLIPRHGLIGAAVATDIAYGFYTLAHLWLCRRLVSLRLATLLWSLACALTAAAAMAIVLAEIGTKHLSPGDWLLGAIGGAATYLAMLLFTGELRVRDLRVAGQAVGRIVPGVLAVWPAMPSLERRRKLTTPRSLAADAAMRAELLGPW
jgi:Polysaccharide biosynthesis C-terminal domain